MMDITDSHARRKKLFFPFLFSGFLSRPLVPGMSQFSEDVDMDSRTADHPGNKKLSQEPDVESVI
jgi:hypothetical protein